MGFGELTLSNILTIIAMVLAPLIALQVSRLLQESKEIRQRKVELFRTLMKTRASTLSPEHVEALNMIDVEFYGNNKKDKAVVEAWKSYLDHLNQHSTNIETWSEKREDLLIELLEKMAISLNYDFGKSHIKKTSYFPQGYVELEMEQKAIRTGLIDLLEAKRAMSVMVTTIENAEPQPAKKESA